MAYELRFDTDDLLRCRFAISPIWEAHNAIRVLHTPRMQQFHLSWFRRHRPDVPDLTPLMALYGPDWGPDFLVPPPEGPVESIDDQLDRVRSTPVELVLRDLRQAYDAQPDAAAREIIKRCLADPAAARDRLADLLGRAFGVLLKEDWVRLRTLLEADIAYRARILAERGLAAVFADLGDRLELRGETLFYRTRLSGRHDLGGRGLLLMPSAFIWPSTAVMQDPPWQPTIIYPARGVGALWHRPAVEPGEPLARLIGRTRAMILVSLDEPADTTSLARRLELSAAGVSAHLTTLRDAGLVTARRDRHKVLYERTPLGLALLNSP